MNALNVAAWMARKRWTPPDRLVGCVNTSLGQQFRDIPKGQCEPGIEPDRVADNFWREAVALKRYRSHPMMLIGVEPQSYPSSVTLPSAPLMVLGVGGCDHPWSKIALIV